MSTDIRLSTDFFTHWKTKVLQEELGSDGVVSLITFWLSSAHHRPSGKLNGYTERRIEIDANWKGERGLFVNTLIDIGFLEKNGKQYCIHNWAFRQPWVAESEDRSDKARFSKLASVNPDAYMKLRAQNVSKISKPEYEILKSQKIQTEPINYESTNDRQTTVNETPSPSPSPKKIHQGHANQGFDTPTHAHTPARVYKSGKNGFSCPACHGPCTTTDTECPICKINLKDAMEVF